MLNLLYEKHKWLEQALSPLFILPGSSGKIVRTACSASQQEEGHMLCVFSSKETITLSCSSVARENAELPKPYLNVVIFIKKNE